MGLIVSAYGAPWYFYTLALDDDLEFVNFVGSVVFVFVCRVSVRMVRSVCMWFVDLLSCLGIASCNMYMLVVCLLSVFLVNDRIPSDVSVSPCLAVVL